MSYLSLSIRCRTAPQYKDIGVIFRSVNSGLNMLTFHLNTFDVSAMVYVQNIRLDTSLPRDTRTQDCIGCCLTLLNLTPIYHPVCYYYSNI